MKTIRPQPFRGRTTIVVAALMLGLVLGLGIGTTISAVEADEPVAAALDVDTAIKTLVNVIASLAVDTERSAIGIAGLNGLIAKLERRVAALEARLEDD